MSEPYNSSLINTKSSFMIPNHSKDLVKIKLFNYRKVIDKIFNYRYNIYEPRYYVEDTFTYHYTSSYGERLVIINLIHDGRHFCFNAPDREILYAIKDCVQIYHGKNYAEFKECGYGKALNFKPIHLPLDPPFENIMVYFQKNYFMRLTLLEQHFVKKNHTHDHLIAKKKALYKYPPICIYLLLLPKDTIDIISDFITYVDFKKCQEVRNEYEKERTKVS